MYLDIEQILLCIDPVVPAADRGAISQHCPA